MYHSSPHIYTYIDQTSCSEEIEEEEEKNYLMMYLRAKVENKYACIYIYIIYTLPFRFISTSRESKNFPPVCLIPTLISHTSSSFQSIYIYIYIYIYISLHATCLLKYSLSVNAVATCI
jgi:hypothetical protein